MFCYTLLPTNEKLKLKLKLKLKETKDNNNNNNNKGRKKNFSIPIFLFLKIQMIFILYFNFHLPPFHHFIFFIYLHITLFFCLHSKCCLHLGNWLSISPIINRSLNLFLQDTQNIMKNNNKPPLYLCSNKIKNDIKSESFFFSKDLSLFFCFLKKSTIANKKDKNQIVILKFSIKFFFFSFIFFVS